VRVFGELVKKGYIYRGLKPVLWCPVDETALADAEVEYGEHTSESIFVRYPLLNDPNNVFEGMPNSYVAIWTTTPWTIPANLAVAASAEFDYAIVKVPDGNYLILEDLIPRTMEAAGITDYNIIKTIPGSELEGLVFKHPIFDRPSPMLLAERDHKGEPFVSATDGTGIIHIAPGHGESDFYLGMEKGLEVLNPVDTRGYFTDLAGEFAGLYAPTEGNLQVIERLKEIGNLLAHQPFAHQYPHCWRCHTALMFRATVQWFMNIDHNRHRERCLEAIQHTDWYPSQSINRITAMVANRPDWCLSRQRAWGVGIPAFYCSNCNEPLMTPESIEAVAMLVQEENSDAWYVKPAEEILPKGTKCDKCGGTHFTKEQDVLDVWFDSGSTNIAVLDHRSELSWPADLYLEGSDQHRGWFNTSLMVAMGAKDAAPYRAVVTHGFVLDEARYKMAKSRGNVLEPLEMCKKYGADVLRLWSATSDYFEDVSISENIMQNNSTMYRDIRNSLRFMLANLYDYDSSFEVPYKDMLEIDRWALGRLYQVVATATEAYDGFEFTKVTSVVNQFVTVDLSPLYLDVLKDRLYTFKADSPARRSAQTAFQAIASALTRLLAPVLAHTAEEVWSYLPVVNKQKSVHLEAFPEPNPEWNDKPLLERWEKLLQVREMVGPEIEKWRQSFKDEATKTKARDLGESQVTLYAGPELFSLLEAYINELGTLFKVSKATVLPSSEPGIKVEVGEAPGEKCDRCWLVQEDIGVSENHPSLCSRCVEAVGV
jgi:isoleucyl-tRNA synthetase